jgi:hypothetical protein
MERRKASGRGHGVTVDGVGAVAGGGLHDSLQGVQEVRAAGVARQYMCVARQSVALHSLR